MDTWTAGAGLELLSKFQVDYSLESHPELGRVNRISLTWFIGGKKPLVQKTTQQKTTQQKPPLQKTSQEQTPKANAAEALGDSKTEESTVPQDKPTEQEVPEVLEDSGEILEDDDEEILE